MNTTTTFETFSLDVTKEHAEEQIAYALKRDGIITFDSIRSTEGLLQFCARLGIVIRHRDSDESGLTRIVTHDALLPTDNYRAFGTSSLTLHTDGSSMPEPATLLVLWCTQPAEDGGMSLFVDGKQIYQVLVREYPQILQTLATPNSAIFAGSQPPLSSCVFSTLTTGNICLRFRYDSLAFYTAPACGVLPTFLELLQKDTISFNLKKYQGYIIQNGRWLHGRTAFHGNREMYRVLICTTTNKLIGKRISLGFDPAL